MHLLSWISGWPHASYSSESERFLVRRWSDDLGLGLGSERAEALLLLLKVRDWKESLSEAMKSCSLEYECRGKSSLKLMFLTYGGASLLGEDRRNRKGQNKKVSSMLLVAW